MPRLSGGSGGSNPFGAAIDASEVAADVATQAELDGVAEGVAKPEDFSFLAWNFDSGLVGAGATATNQSVYATRMTLRRAQTITNIHFCVTAIATTATYGRVALFSLDGATQHAISADLSASLNAGTGMKTWALGTPYAAAAGTYWVTFLQDSTTAAQLGRGAASSSTHPHNLGKTLGNLRWAIAATGQASMPATITPGSFTANANAFWVALS